MKKIFFFVFVLLSTLYVFSQSDISKNGLYIGSVQFLEGKYVVQIHKFLTKELIRQITLGTQKPEEIKFSNTGMYFYTKIGKNLTLYDVLQGNVIKNLANVSQLTFSDNDQYFYLLTITSFSKYETETSKLVQNYSYPQAKTIIEILLSPDNKTIAAKSVDKIFFYQTNSSEIKNQFVGYDVKFSEKGQYSIVISNVNGKIRVVTYNNTTFYQEKAVFSDVLLQNAKITSELFPSRSSISPNGTYLALYTAKGNRVEIAIFNTYTGLHTWTINNFANTSNELYPIEWLNDITLIGYGEQLMVGRYNIISKTSEPLALRIDDISSANLTPDKQKQNRKLSPFYNFIAVPDGNNLLIRDCRIPNKRISYPNAQFVGFTPDENFLFIRKDGILNAIPTKGISQAVQNNSTAKLYAFDTKLAAKAEQIIVQDATPPKGYAYFMVNNTKQIVLVDTAKLKMNFRSLKINQNEVELHINLVDRNANEFLGATDPSWSFIWCNLLLQNPSGEVTQINDFVVEERYEQEPVAYCLVLDHSGSMGDERINKLQYGAWNLIRNKKNQDEYSLIKYDNLIKLAVGLTTDKTKFQTHLSGTGTKGFGGTTALVDATYLAAKLLNKSNLQRKAIILFTDGYENASLTPIYTLLDFSVQNKIQINVIGFGKEINEQYLKNIAYNTGGIYSSIFKTQDLTKIFQDIDFKRRHYYSIKFKTKSQGKHVAFLQLCQDLLTHDSIWVPFDNSVINKPPEERNIVTPLDPSKIRLTDINKYKIPINPVLKVVTDKKINNDFGNITFPNILFATASDKIVSSEEKGINQIVDFMRKYPNVLLQIHGHTDNVGTPEFNMDLSIKRANAAKKLIVAKGIAPGRIITKGFGNTQPVAPNDTEINRAQNRRIEFHIFVQ